MADKTTEKALEEGFVPLTESDDEIRFFWKKETGAIIRGTLLGRFERPGDDGGFFYEIKATAPCSDVQCREYDEEGNGTDTDRTAEVGDTVRVDETSTLRRHLLPYIKGGRRIEVFIRCTRKVKLSGGRSFWKMEVMAKDLTPQRSIDDLPF